MTMLLVAMAILLILNMALDRTCIKTLGIISEHLYLIYHREKLVPAKGIITQREWGLYDESADKALAFSYKFQNKEYMNDTYRLGMYFSNPIEHSQLELSKFEINQEIDIFVHRDNPEISVIETTKNPFPALLIFLINLSVLCLLWGLLIFCFIYWLKTLG